MARFRTVQVYPMSGWWDRPWIEDDVDADAFAKVSRGICDLYSADLAAADVQHVVSTLRIFVGEIANSVGNRAGELPPATEDGRARVLAPTYTGRPETFEQAGVAVPAGFAAWPLARQQRVVLDAVHQAAVGVAMFRGLGLTPFEHARQAVEDADFTFRWSSPWKFSPGRRWRARCAFQTMPDGFGRLVLEVAARDDNSLYAQSSEQVAWTTQEGYRRAAQTLRWTASDRVEVIPSVGPFSLIGGTFIVQVQSDAGRPELHEEEVPIPE